MNGYISKEKMAALTLPQAEKREEDLELEVSGIAEKGEEKKDEFLLPSEYFAENLQGRDAWRNLFERFPTVTAADLPEQVYEDVRSGMSPFTAYIKNENAELRREIARLKKLENNRRSAIGALGDSGNPGSKDPFLYGFSEAFR